MLRLANQQEWPSIGNRDSAARLNLKHDNKQMKRATWGCYSKTDLEAKVVVVKVSIIYDLAVQTLGVLHKSKNFKTAAKQTAQQCESLVRGRLRQSDYPDVGDNTIKCSFLTSMMMAKTSSAIKGAFCPFLGLMWLYMIFTLHVTVSDVSPAPH